MPIPSFSRRTFANRSAAALGLLQPALATAAEPSGPARALHVVCVGAHPDDPESGCGGTLARYSESGHRVTIVYLTRGEAGIRGKSHEESATRPSDSRPRLTSTSPPSGKRRRPPCSPIAVRTARKSIGNTTRSWKTSVVASWEGVRPRPSLRWLTTIPGGGCRDSSDLCHNDLLLMAAEVGS